MLIIGELLELKQMLLKKSSLKEQAFYQFLVDKPLSYPAKNDLAEIEQICYSVFCTDIPLNNDLTNLIKAQRRKRPIGGMHYTENLIELIAMALENLELERNTLKAYSESHPTTDFYILHVLFPASNSNTPIAQGTIDEIALHLYKESFPEKWKTLLLNGLEETSDLIDLYVIEQWYKRAMDDNPIVHRTNDIIYVKDTCVHFVKKTERQIKFTIGIVSALPLISISCWLGILIFRNWDEAEPIIAGTEICLFVINVLLIIFGVFIPDKIDFINSSREKIINWVFKKKGFNRLELKERLGNLVNEDEQ